MNYEVDHKSYLLAVEKAISEDHTLWLLEINAELSMMQALINMRPTVGSVTWQRLAATLVQINELWRERENRAQKARKSVNADEFRIEIQE